MSGRSASTATARAEPKEASMTTEPSTWRRLAPIARTSASSLVRWATVIVNVREIGVNDDALAIANAILAEPDLDPGDVVRVYDRKAVSIDVRTGEMVRGLPLYNTLREYMLSQLPVPEMIATGLRDEDIDDGDRADG